MATNNQKTDLLFKQFTGVVNASQLDSFSNSNSNKFPFQPYILGQDVLIENIPNDLSNISYPDPDNVGKFVYGIHALDLSFQSLNYSMGISYEIPNTPLIYYYKIQLEQALNTTPRTFYKDDGANSNSSLLKDSIPFLYDPIYKSYFQRVYTNDGTGRINMYSRDLLWLFDYKSGFLQFYGSSTTVVQDWVTNNGLPRISVIVYNGNKGLENFLGGAGISDNYLIKVVGGVTTQTNMIETSISNTSTSLKISIPSTPFSIFSGDIETEIFDTIKRRMHLTTNGIQSTNGITITSDGRVGIGIVAPEEDFEIDGSIQIDSANVSRLKFQKSGQNPHAEGEIDAEEDGTDGGQLEFYTKVDGDSVTEKLRINNVGAIGIGGANYGNSGQVIVSNGSGSAVSWVNQTDTTYSAGTGVNISPSNQISIGQSVETTDAVTFKSLNILKDYFGVPIDPIINFTDNQNGGTLAHIQMLGDGVNAGQLQFFTKRNGGPLQESFSIRQNGNVGINTTDPTYRLQVVGDIKGDNLFLGAYGETPKIDMLYAQSTQHPQAYGDKRITIGVVDDFPNTIYEPAFPPTGSMGINIQNNSDAFFIGIEEHATGEYRPLLKWGDDGDDTPFTIQSYNGNNKWEFGLDGILVVPNVVKGASGTVCKIHILPFTDAETANVSSGAFTDVVGKTFTKTAGTNLFGEVHINYTISGFGGDAFAARLNFFNNPGITGGDYDIINIGGLGGGGGRSGDINGAAVYTDGTGTTNYGSQGIYLQAKRNGGDDTITFKAGFFKVTEIWA